MGPRYIKARFYLPLGEGLSEITLKKGLTSPKKGQLADSDIR